MTIRSAKISISNVPNDHILCRFPKKRQSSLSAAAVFQNPRFKESNPSHHSAETCDHQQVALHTEMHGHCKKWICFKQTSQGTFSTAGCGQEAWTWLCWVFTVRSYVPDSLWRAESRRLKVNSKPSRTSWKTSGMFVRGVCAESVHYG